MDNHLLIVNNLSIHYFIRTGIVRAVEGISFSMKTKETLGIVGESGCGKTTIVMGLINMVSSPGKIVEGEIVYKGRNIAALPEQKLRQEVRWTGISMVFQGAMNCLTPVYTIKKQMLETLAIHRRMKKDEALSRIKKYISLVGLPGDVIHKYPHELSGGMKQRVVIATALFLEPDLVICDEPTTALDVVVQAQIINLLKKIKKQLGLSVIFITHDLATVAEVAENILVMYGGRMMEYGTNEQVFGKTGPAHPYTECLLKATPRLGGEIRELSFIPGIPPDLIHPEPGCCFHPRCPYVFDKCRHSPPPLFHVGPGHYAACWRVDHEGK
ncbi:MAG: ABC transporter ATP-binding protein [Spirochaetales bacterium]|nr:ABC transporter ATP-binding protein [Spirochaetales bacterium]